MVSNPSSSSLEDCLTNVVSWTEFTGLHWMSLISPNPVDNPNRCPILKTYNECQRNRIFSFWRRRPNPLTNLQLPHQPGSNLPHFKSPIITGKEVKELWIFWYESSKPAIVDQYSSENSSNELVKDSDGSFDINGLDYKIRILLYDALHRILESGCASKKFIRFGKWFCQPLTELISTRKKVLPQYMIAFQFTFCTFGNQVCISPRFQRQPTLLSITKKHLLQKIRQKVILAPWGIVGYILPDQSHFDFNNPAPTEAEAEKAANEKPNLLSSFGGLYSTPEKDKSKKQLDDLLKKYYEDFIFSVGYPDIGTVSPNLPNLLAVEIDGISTYWPTVLLALCIDDLKDGESEEEEEGSDIEFVDPPSTSPNSYYAGCRAAQRLFEDALLPPPIRQEERLSLMDCTQKELCMCKACNASEAPFDALPSISPAGIFNPNTPHSVQTKISEPPSVPPTSIESVHSTSGDLKHLRRPPRLRYKQPQFSFQTDFQKDRPKSPKVEAEIEESRRNDPGFSWAHNTSLGGEYPINQVSSNDGYTVANHDSIWNILPVFRGDQEWDENSQAIQRPPSPYTPVNIVTPEYSQYNTDDESMTMDQDFPRRDKPNGVITAVREEEPNEQRQGESSMLRSLLESTDDSSPPSPAKSHISDYDEDFDDLFNEQQWRRRKRGNGGVTIDFIRDDFKRRRIYMSNLPAVDIGRIGVPTITDYFVPGELPYPDFDEEGFYYPAVVDPDYSEDDEEEDEGEQENNGMNVEPYPIANPQNRQQQPSMEVYNEFGNLVEQPSSTFDDLMLDASELMEVDPNIIGEPSTLDQDANNATEGQKSLTKALQQVIKPISDSPINDEIAESTKKAVEAFQKANPFPLSEEAKRKQKLEEDDLIRSILSPDPEPIPILSRHTLRKVYNTIHRRMDPFFDIIEDIQGLLPSSNIYKDQGCVIFTKNKEFCGNPFVDACHIRQHLFDAIDARDNRSAVDPPPKYIKKESKKKAKEMVPNINLQKAEEKEYDIRSQIIRNQNLLQQQQRAALFHQRHSSSIPYMSNSPQMNGMMFNNNNNNTPSPMSSARYMQPLSNTLTVCGSGGAGGSVQMADIGIGMNPGSHGGYPMGHPPMTSTPNSMMPYGPSPQAFIPPPPYNSMMSNGYNQQQQQPQRMPSSDSLLLNAFDPPMGFSSSLSLEVSGQQLFEKIQKSLGFLIAALLRDSILDLHFDAVYDSCPLCSCTESIRTNEYGTYLQIPSDVQVADRMHLDENSVELRFGGFFMKLSKNSADSGQSDTCYCAFSAIRHRYLCAANSNLFTDDIREATGGPVVVEVEKPELKWFNPLKSADWKFIDVFRWYLLGHDLSAYIRTGWYIGDVPSIEKIEEFDGIVSPKKEYTVNGIDQGELDFIVSSVLDSSTLFGNPMIMNERLSRRNPDGNLTPLIHPWAVQLSENTLPLNDIEYSGFSPKVFEILEDIAQLVRGSSAMSGKITEGPLTWKSLHQKATKMYKIQKSENEEDTSHNPEPIPNIVVGSDKDLLLTLPTAIWAWERVGLTPYSWPKNVLYLAVIPEHSFATEKTKSFAENSLITEKCKIFLEDLSMVYEKHRFGRHLPLPPKIKDSTATLNNGIIKIPLQNFNNSNDQKSLVQKLEYFVSQYLQLFTRIFGEMECFDKRTFLEAVYREFYADHHSSAVPMDASAIPPTPQSAGSNSQQIPNSTSSPMAPADSSSFNDSPMFNHQQPQQQNINSPLPNMFDSGNLNPRTPDQMSSSSGNNNGNNFAATSPEEPLSSTSITNGVDELMINDEDNPALPHVLVIYIVNPFFFGSANTQEYFSKLVTVKLLKSFNNILANLDLVKRPRVQVELIDIRTIFDYSAYSCDPLQEYFHPLNQSTVADPLASINALRKLAFTVYSQPRQLHVESIRDMYSKSMTRFGPFSQASDILDTLVQNPSSTYRIPTAPFILAPKSSSFEITPQGKLKLKNPDEKVLFVTYCLVKDDFLIVSVTDDRGELNDTKVISISRRTNQSKPNLKPTSQISLVFDAVHRLWAYIQGVMSLDTKNWRLVIGRFGKIGHGEFKAWTSILGKKNLQAYNSILKGKDKELQTPAIDKPSALTITNSCKTCSLNPGYLETPALIAACLVSTEADAYFKVFPELLVDPKQKSNKIIPNDYSITHIMVFPTSPWISNETDVLLTDEKDDMDFFAAQDDNAAMELDVDIDININELGDVNSATTTIANQPIAMGFLISTAPALNVPDWFWSQSPNAKNDTPVHLRSALHISVPHVQQNDDVMLAMAENHPLESNKTEEVLTYILQTYNELSWLNIDIITGQRQSCLPIHIQKLLTLYNSLNTTFY